MSAANLDFFDLSNQPFEGLVHEELMDRIWDVSAVPLPLTELISSTTIGNARTAWVIDELAAPNNTTNALVDGADAPAGNDAEIGDRVSNLVQMLGKVVRVSDRGDQANVVGDGMELAQHLPAG